MEYVIHLLVNVNVLLISMEMIVQINYSNAKIIVLIMEYAIN